MIPPNRTKQGFVTPRLAWPFYDGHDCQMPGGKSATRATGSHLRSFARALSEQMFVQPQLGGRFVTINLFRYLKRAAEVIRLAVVAYVRMGNIQKSGI